ncbi:MAG: hypothetical protein ACTSUT_05510 [Promethearchaeota archaeon]
MKNIIFISIIFPVFLYANNCNRLENKIDELIKIVYYQGFLIKEISQEAGVSKRNWDTIKWLDGGVMINNYTWEKREYMEKLSEELKKKKK